MQIFVDLDSTLNKLHVKWLAAIKDTYGEEFSREDVTSWEFLGNKRYLPLITQEGFFRDLEVEEGAVRALQAAIEEGHEVFILSAAGPWNYRDKDEWVFEHFPFLPKTNIIFATHKHFLAAPGRVLIDDGAHNLEAWRKHKGLALCFDQPWNQEYDGMRIKSWQELATANDWWCYPWESR